MKLRIVLCGLLIVLLAGCNAAQFQSLITHLSDTPTAAAGDPVRGETIFREGVGAAPPCITCHQVTTGGFAYSIGPNLADIAHVASTRVEGMDAEAYIRESILDPGAHVAPGYRNIMYPNFANDLSAQDIDDLVAFLMTLDGTS